MADLRLVSGNEDGGNGEHNNVVNGEAVRIWERQPNETIRAFAAFNEYLQMGPQRSLAKLGQKLGKSTALLEGWSMKHDWQRRVSAFTRHESKVINDRIVEGAAAMRERHAVLGQQLQQRAQARILKMNEQEIDHLHPTDAAMMMKVGSELERQARKVEDGEYAGFGWDVAVPSFTQQNIHPGLGDRMIAVELPDENGGWHSGFIPPSRIREFLNDHPEANVLDFGSGSEMVGVQITSGPFAGRHGYIRADQVERFSIDHPDWRVLA